MTPFATITTRDVVRVSGPDAIKFLQGQISQNVDALAVNTSTWTFVLAPQGKVDAWARITKVAADAFLIDLDAGYGAAVATRLSRFKIRTNAEIETMTWRCVSVRGPGAPHDDVADGVLRLPLGVPGHAGYDLLGDAAEAPDGVAISDETALTADRIRHGVPAMGAELTDATIPAEVGQWIIDGSVSFTKGCYVGQELVARIDSRGGNVPRHLRVIDGVADAAVGDDVLVDGVRVGELTSIAPGSGTALAYIARRVEVGASATVGSDAVLIRDPEQSAP